MKVKGSILFQLLIFGAILGVFFFGFSNAQYKVGEKDLFRVQEAIQKAALECYSTEGKYPENVSYLEEHYGLYLQKDSYEVRYEFIAANLMPSTNVYQRED